MTESATYNVVLSGDILSGFEITTVADAFAKMFNLSPEKARSMVGSQIVIKKEVELQVAESYQHKLTSIGIEVELKKLGDPTELSLEPMQERVPGADGAEQPMLEVGQMLCPKCKSLQEKAEECVNCGVYIHKVLGMADASGKLGSRD
jgi:hypothetical protein